VSHQETAADRSDSSMILYLSLSYGLKGISFGKSHFTLWLKLPSYISLVILDGFCISAPLLCVLPTARLVNAETFRFCLRVGIVIAFSKGRFPIFIPANKLFMFDKIPSVATHIT
jgi:hypothetical protein